jgi:hypothetical protein
MADHRAPSQQVNPILANPYPHPAPYQLQGQVRMLHFSHYRRRLSMCIVIQNPDVAGDYQEGVHWEGVPQLQPVGNIVMQGEMQYPPHIG